MGMKEKSINPREIREEDFEAVQVLCQSQNIPLDGTFFWQHHWLENPTFLKLEGRWPIGWVLAKDSGDIVGFLGNIPLTYEWEDQQLIVAATSTWVVEPEFRSYSLSLMSRYFKQKHVDLLLCTTASRETGKAWLGFHARPLPQPDYEKVLYWITGYDGFVQAFFRKKSWFPVLPLCPVLSLTLRGFDFIRNIFSSYPGHGIFSVFVMQTFDDQFDIFWEKIRKRKKLLVVRNRVSLHWYFSAALGEKKAWILKCEREGKMVGYAVFIHRDRSDIGLKRASLVDLQVLDNMPGAVEHLILLGIQECGKRGIHLLESIGFDAEKRLAMKCLSPRIRPLPNSPFYFKFKNKILDKRFEHPEYWDGCTMDGDACF